MCSSVIKRFLQENIHPTSTRTQIRLRVATSLIFASEEVAEAGQAEVTPSPVAKPDEKAAVEPNGKVIFAMAGASSCSPLVGTSSQNDTHYDIVSDIHIPLKRRHKQVKKRIPFSRFLTIRNINPPEIANHHLQMPQAAAQQIQRQ